MLYIIRSRFCRWLIAAICAGGATLSPAQVLDSMINMQNNSNQQAAQSQDRIDRLADETEQLLTEYRQVVSETESLKVYNAQLRRLVENQRKELASIERQLAELESTNQAVTPLMINMVNTLGEIVERDVPFRVVERRNRFLDMQALLDNPNVTVSEKFRRIMELYQGEINYGRTTAAYQGKLPSGESVNMLRVGRTLLLYQSLDGETTGWWNPTTRQFEELGNIYRLPVKDGIAIAQSRRAPDLIKLPVPGPTDAQ